MLIDFGKPIISIKSITHHSPAQYIHQLQNCLKMNCIGTQDSFYEKTLKLNKVRELKKPFDVTKAVKILAQKQMITMNTQRTNNGKIKRRKEHHGQQKNNRE